MASAEELLDELVRMKALELKNTFGSQADTIIELSKAGFSPARIASLLGTTPGTVSVAVQRAKKKTSKEKSND